VRYGRYAQASLFSVNDSRQVVVSVSARGLLVVAAALVLAWALLSAGTAVLVILASFFAALVLDPPVTKLAARKGMSRGRAALLMVGLCVLVGLVVSLALLIPMLRDLMDFLHALPQTIADIRASDAFKSLDQKIDFGSDSQEQAANLAARVPETLANFVGLAGNVFGFFFIIFEFVFLTLFLLTDMPQLSGGLESVLYPKSAERYGRLRRQITTTVSRYALGAGLIAVIAGTTMGLTAWVLGTPHVLALALIAGLLDLIPQVGATIAGAILVLATIPVGIPQAVVMLIVVLVYQQAENYILQPTIQGRTTQISGFLVIASVLVFGAVLGIFGALVAVPVTAAAQIVIGELTSERRARIAEMTPVLEQS
jgi:predicted PurR-regulated permease PerM